MIIVVGIIISDIFEFVIWAWSQPFIEDSNVGKAKMLRPRPHHLRPRPGVDLQGLGHSC